MPHASHAYPRSMLAERMKALVLTFDRNAAVAEHMMRRYDAAWPDHPFEFVVPFQDPSHAADSPRRRLVRSRPGIRDTILTLIGDLPDDAWVYWCIDDKYPIELRTDRIARIAAAIRAGVPDRVSGILCCRARRMLDPAFLSGERLSLGGETLLRRVAFQQIWIHQFVRVKVLRHLFRELPCANVTPPMLEAHKDQTPLPGDHALFVTQENLATFGESTHSGVLTSNCVASMKRIGIPIPSWQPPIPTGEVLIGVLPPGHRR